MSIDNDKVVSIAAITAVQVLRLNSNSDIISQSDFDKLIARLNQWKALHKAKGEVGNESKALEETASQETGYGIEVMWRSGDV